MKKLFAFMLSALLLASVVTLSVSAAGNGSFSMTGAEGKPGDTVEVKVNLATNPGLITMKFAISWDAGLELTGVKDTGLLKGWTTPAPTISSPYTIRWADSLSTENNAATGHIVTLTFKISDSATVGTKNVSLTFNESRDAAGQKNSFGNASTTVKVVCAQHNFGASTDTGLGTHVRSCTVCGFAERPNHTWDAGTVTTKASCKEEGSTHYKCTACGAEKDEVIAKTDDHAYTAWIQNLDPKCTAAGEKTRTCSICQKTEKQSIRATGHSYGEFTVILEPTLTTEGMKQRKCKECNHTEEQVIPCFATDEANGLTVQVGAGDFAEGTEMKVSPVTSDDDAYQTIADLLKDIGGKFSAFVLEFVANDATVQPKNPMNITAKAPEYTNLLLYIVNENGELTPVQFTKGTDGTVSFTSAVAGTFVFVDEGSQPDVPEDKPQDETPEVTPPVSSTDSAPVTSTGAAVEEDENDNGGMVIGMIAIVVLVIAAGAVSYWYFFIKKK